MAGTEATISDFTDRFSTNLDPSSGGPIDDALTYAQELNQEYNSEANQTATQTKNIELYAALIHIRTNWERSVESESGGGFSATYEADELAQARSQLRQWIQRAGGDTSMADALGGVIRDTQRNIATTDES